MKPLLFIAAFALTLPVMAVAADRPVAVQACLKAAEAKVTQTSAYRNGSIREKQALLRRADVRQAKAQCTATL